VANYGIDNKPVPLGPQGSKDSDKHGPQRTGQRRSDNNENFPGISYDIGRAERDGEMKPPEQKSNRTENKKENYLLFILLQQFFHIFIPLFHYILLIYELQISFFSVMMGKEII
jgi:hypothetical protein